MRISRCRELGLTAMVAALGAAALPASVPAATTIGHNLAGGPPTNGISCAPAGCTVVNSALAPASAAAGGLVAPSDGVVTEWRIKAGSNTSAMTPRVIRTVTGVMRTGVATGAPVTPPVNQTSSFDTRLPIKAGQYFAVDQAGTTIYFRSGITGSSIQFWSTPLANDGPAMSGVTNANIEMLVNADIEADTDGDGYGDETQDACPADATTQGPCPDKTAPDTTITKAPKRKSTKKRVSVAFSSSEPGATFECMLDAEPFAPCASPLTLKVKRGRHTFSVRGVDAAGNVDASPATANFKRKKRKPPPG